MSSVAMRFTYMNAPPISSSPKVVVRRSSLLRVHVTVVAKILLRRTVSGHVVQGAVVHLQRIHELAYHRVENAIRLLLENRLRLSLRAAALLEAWVHRARCAPLPAPPHASPERDSPGS